MSMVTDITMAKLSGSGAGSLWDGLSPHLIARIYEVDNQGNAIPDGPVVYAPFADDVQLDIELNWQSPFESAGTDSALPTTAAALQSGAAENILKNLGFDGISGIAAEATGRSGMTKLNSTQIFNGMPPLRIQGELLFRAWNNAESEVERPVDQLVSWALPKLLAAEGTMVTAAAEYVRSENKGVGRAAELLFPSEVPSLLAITYKGRTYAPVVIERVGVPLSSPIDSNGRFIQMRLPITLATLTAWDRHDWKRSNVGRGW